MRRGIAFCMGALLCGLAWGQPGRTWLIVFALGMPMLWSRASTRGIAGAAACSYYLAASRGLPHAAGIFFAESAPAWFNWALWLAAAAVNALPWLLLWRPIPGGRAVTLPLALFLTIAPPIGLIGWANPLTAASVLFPATGFLGLVITVAALCASVRRSIWLLIPAGIAVVSNAVAAVREPPAWLNAWASRDTSLPGLQTAAADDPVARARRVLLVVAIAREIAPQHVVVMPETVLPLPTKSDEFGQQLLDDAASELRARGSVLLVGGEIWSAEHHLENALIPLGSPNAPLIQRVPVPIGMWQPWASKSVQPQLSGPGVGTVSRRRVSYLICYEQFLTFPVLVSLAHKPELIIGAANDWWARDTSIPVIQSQAIDAWGRLFGIPVLRATNI